MIQHVIGGFAGIVVVDGAVVVMVVMGDVLVMFDLVRDGGVSSAQQRAPLHGKAMERQAHQQADTNNSAHGEFLEVNKL